MLKVLPAVMCATALLLGMSGCEQSEPDTADRAALEQLIHDYLDGLAEAYSSMSLEPLEGLASPNEIAAVRQLLRQLTGTGDRLEATLRNVEIDHLEVFRSVNATVRLIEVWDLVRYDAFNGRVKGRSEGSLQSTILQFRKVDGHWIVVGRSIMQRPTPPPDDTPSPLPIASPTAAADTP